MLKFEIYSDNEPNRLIYVQILSYNIFVLYINNFGLLLLPLFVFRMILQATTKQNNRIRWRRWSSKWKKERYQHTHTHTQHKSRRMCATAAAAVAYDKFLENIITHLNLIFKHNTIRIANFRRIPKFDSSIKILFLVFGYICISVGVCIGIWKCFISAFTFISFTCAQAIVTLVWLFSCICK